MGGKFWNAAQSTTNANVCQTQIQPEVALKSGVIFVLGRGEATRIDIVEANRLCAELSHPYEK